MTDTKPEKYPYLGQFRAMIVLFKSPHKGTVVFNTELGYEIGEYREDWHEGAFKEVQEP